MLDVAITQDGQHVATIHIEDLLRRRRERTYKVSVERPGCAAHIYQLIGVPLGTNAFALVQKALEELDELDEE